MRRRTYVAATGTALVSGLAGCLGSGGDDERDDDHTDSTGSLATVVGEAGTPEVDIDDFESLVVTVEELWLRPGTVDTNTVETPSAIPLTVHEDDDEDDSESTPEENDRVIELDDVELDLVDAQTDAVLLDETDLEVGEFVSVILVLGDDIDYELTDEASPDEEDDSGGDTADETASGTDRDTDTATRMVDHGTVDPKVTAPPVLNFYGPFDIREGVRTEFTATFAPYDEGFQEYILLPVAAAIDASYE